MYQLTIYLGINESLFSKIRSIVGGGSRWVQYVSAVVSSHPEEEGDD